MTLQSAGAELVAVEIDSDGALTNVWSDGTESPAGHASAALMDRQRARDIATHSILRRQRRLWPQPRI